MVEGETEVFGQRLNQLGGEMGTNDFRISDMGADMSAVYTAGEPRVAYDATADEYLVVWTGDDNVGGLVAGEHEVFGQLLDGAGAEVGPNDFRISEMGGTGNADPGAVRASVASDPSNGFLVVWQGYVNPGGVDVFGQYVTTTGLQVGPNDDSLSDVVATDRDSTWPSVVFGPGEYLTVWLGMHDALILNEWEVFGQRVTGSPVPLLVSSFETGNLTEWSEKWPP
jgi:hypothetical protein